jgi:hypothetical protein
MTCLNDIACAVADGRDMKLALLIAAAMWLALSPARAAGPANYEPVWSAGTADAGGNRIGGTELRNLVVQDGKLFAANGYWMDKADPTGAGPQIMVLDAAGRPWRIDHEFDDRVFNGRRRHIAISALASVTFRTDRRGAALNSPVERLLTSTWDVTGRRMVFMRDNTTGTWSGAFLAHSTPRPNFLPQIRSFGFHRDRQTGVDMAFAGDTDGIFTGVFDPAAPGQISWNTTPELSTQGLGADQFPGLDRRGLRISSFAESPGRNSERRLYAAIGQQVWVRDDGPSPRWRHLYTNPQPHFGETGLRGLTTVSDPGGDYLLAAVEGMQSRIVRIDPVTGSDATDLDLDQMLDTAWGTRVGYVISAYNDMATAGGDLLIGLEAYIPPAAPKPAGHNWIDLHGGMEAGGWFLIRHPGGHYELHQITARFPGFGENLVAVRTLAASPFPGEKSVFYAGGYDCNEMPAHDTAWIARFMLR